MRSLTVRWKLALLLGGLLVASGASLLGVSYLLLRQTLPDPATFCIQTVRVGEDGVPRPVPASTEVPAGAGIRGACASDPSRLPTDLVGPPPGDAVVVGSTDGRTQVAGPEAGPDGDRLLIAGQPPTEFLRSDRARTLRSALLGSGGALALLAATAVTLGWWLAGRILRPVHEITGTARRLSLETLDQRIAMQGPDDELKELADTFDAMLGRLDAAVAGQRRFVADASHELRTPLAVLRTEVDVALADPSASVGDLRAMGERIRDAVVRAERLVDGLLVLARGDRGLVASGPVDVGALAARAVAEASAEAERLGVTVTTALDPSPSTGDVDLLVRLVANLVENGIRHNEPGGTVVVDTAPGLLRVTNTGPEVDARLVEGLFEPFTRGAARVGGGTGLGLAIVRSVATAHGATVTATARPGGGLVVTVSLSPTPHSAAVATAADRFVRF